MNTVPHLVTTTDGVRIAYAEHGAGPPLVLVRGWISHLEMLWEDPAFRSYMEVLGRHYRVVRYDARGNGLSERVVADVDLDALLLDLEALIEHLELSDIVLYGTTFGGPIAALYAARYPHRVSRLILDGTYAQGSQITSRLRQVIIVRTLRHFPEMAFVLLSHATHPEPQQAKYRRLEVVPQMISPALASQLYSLAFKTDISAVLSAIRVPSLVLHRKDSQSVPLRLGREVASLIPGARLAVLEGSAHNSWEGDAAAALREIGQFLGVDLEPAAVAFPAHEGVVGSAEAPGEETSRYQLLDQMSAGPMGVVYKAQDTRLRRHVALKFLPPTLSKHPDSLGRFDREVRAIAALNHPNICTVHDIGIEARGPFMVMEFLEGENLRQAIGGTPLPTRQLVDWAIQIAEALDAAHSRGIVHRDIKSSNIFITKHGQAKVLDFGLAKLLRPEPTGAAPLETLTQSGVVVGTLGYMSPEQASGEEVDTRSDLFSLGVVLFEMSTGKLPFGGETLQQVLYKILYEAAIPPTQLNPGLPAEVESVITKALEKDRDLRYQSASDIRADMKRLRRDLKTDALT